MSELRFRPKSDYLHTASWDQLYVLTEHWLTDMGFYNDEIRFLENLIDKYFMWLLDDQKIDNVQTLLRQLETTSKTRDALEQDIRKHLQHIEELKENAFSHDEQEYRDGQENLEEELMKFIHTFKQIKKEVFAATEEIMESEKLRNILTT